MDIVVCIKQVPETGDIGRDPETGTLLREGAGGVLNQNDKHALEAALQLREDYGGSITAISMGPPQAEDALREALSMGADKAVLLTGKPFAGADTLSTSYALSLAIKKIKRFDLVICGKETSDGMTAQVGPQIAEFLNLPELTCATHLTLTEQHVRIRQKTERGIRVLEAPLPALVTVEREVNQPRIPPMDSIMEAYREKEVQIWTTKDLEVSNERFGLTGSPTQSKKVYTRQLKRGNVTLLEGEPAQVAGRLIQTLTQKGLL